MNERPADGGEPATDHLVGHGEGPAGTVVDDQLKALGAEVAKLRDDFAEVVPHLVAALKRDRSVEELAARLQEAEKRLATRAAQPLALGLVDLLHTLRRVTETDVRAFVDEQVLELLRAHGYTEFGVPGEPYDPGRHEPIEGRTVAGVGSVRTVHATGFVSGTEVVLKAKVDVLPPPTPPAGASEESRTA